VSTGQFAEKSNGLPDAKGTRGCSPRAKGSISDWQPLKKKGKGHGAQLFIVVIGGKTGALLSERCPKRFKKIGHPSWSAEKNC